MTKNSLEHTQPNRELYIAWNARILDAMKKAAAGLVGTVVEVIPASDKDPSPAVEAAVEAAARLYEQSGEKYLSPGERHVNALLSVEDREGGVVAVEFDDQEDSRSQRDLFRARTVEYLLYQGENIVEGGETDPSRVQTEADLRQFFRVAFLNAQSARGYLEHLGGVERAGELIGPDAVKELKGVLAHVELVRDAEEASEEIRTVNDASLGSRK